MTQEEINREEVIKSLRDWSNTKFENEYPDNLWCDGFARGTNMAKEYVKTILQFINQHETATQNPIGVKVS